MVEFSSSSEILDVIANAATALAYYWLTYQLLAFAVNSKLVKITCALRYSKNAQKRQLFFMLLSVAALFASFISLCGTTHLLSVIRFYHPSSPSVKGTQLVLLFLAAVVSIVTAIIGSKLFPVILDSLGNFEFSSEGTLQHTENYLIEVVEMVRESIIVLSEDFEIIRCNEASKLMLGTPRCIRRNYRDFIHPQDLQIFKLAASRVMGHYSMTPVTVEYRVKRATYVPECDSPASSKSPNSHPHNSKVYADNEEAAPDVPIENLRCTTWAETPVPLLQESGGSDPSFNTFPPAPGQACANYTWIETTLCKGMTLNFDGDFEYDLKLVSRNIEDRRREALREYNDLVRVTEERARMNAAKLRYISCIAHDLKTPLQSFCFSLDLLGHTHMHPEQREFVQQANVAVDLMRLTISQTMDISKALTGAKLLPRRTTVYLSSIMHRVEVIINGFGKEVPVTFEVTADLCDRIITDEEWLWQMILNLLTNACKYTDRGEIRVILSCQAGTKDSSRTSDEEMLLIEVIDTGVGVGDDKIGTMFDAFAQVQEGQVTGTGLGLFGVRTRAEGLLGTCGARHNTESSTGTGTVMWFAIPYVPDISCESPCPRTRRIAYKRTLGIDRAPSLNIVIDNSGAYENTNDGNLTSREEEHMVETLLRERKVHAIVIDDTKTVRKLMERLLLKMGFASVKCYENGSKGLEAMMAAQVDIVFSDVQMPIMTGPEMVRRFRKFEAEALESGARETRQLVVAVTANGSELTDSVNNGFDEVCPKPMSIQDIQNLVQKYF